MTDPLDELIEGLEEISDAFSGNEEAGLDAEAVEPRGNPDVRDVSVEVPGEPEFQFEKIERMHDELDAVVDDLEEVFGEPVVSDAGFWEQFNETVDADIEYTPEEVRSGSEPAATDIIEYTDPYSIVDAREDEGQVRLETNPEEIETVTVDEFKSSLGEIRKLDQGIETFDETLSLLDASETTVRERVEKLEDDIETIESARKNPDANTDALDEARADANSQIEYAEGLLDEASEKYDAIEDRANAWTHDRNQYRGHVKALFKAAGGEDTGASPQDLANAYQGYQIRSGSDTNFRPAVVLHIFSYLNHAQKQHNIPISFPDLVTGMQKTWDYTSDDIESGVNLLLNTGELWQTESGLTFSPLTG